MREILFRGKDKNIGKWVTGNLYQNQDQCFIMANNRNNEVIPETVGQFTGLTDKNGRKIFEGDIVQNTITKVPAIVRWYSEYSAFILYCKKYSRVYFLYDNDFKYIEVIGNIHDNLELLEQEG